MAYYVNYTEYLCHQSMRMYYVGVTSDPRLIGFSDMIYARSKKAAKAEQVSHPSIYAIHDVTVSPL